MSSLYSQWCIDFLQELVQTPSVNWVHNESMIVKKIASKCEELSLPYQILEKESWRPNIFIWEWFDNPTSVLFVAHSDTVPIWDENLRTYWPFSWTIENSKIYGRWTIDCKGGIAASVYALKLLYDIWLGRLSKVVIGADEESGADSEFWIKYVLQKWLQASWAVYTYWWKRKQLKINIWHRGLMRVRITCHWVETHVGSKERQNREKWNNAIEWIVAFIEATKSIPFLNETHDFFPWYKYWITPTIIRWWEWESIVPGHAKALLDIRTLPTRPSQEVIDALHAIGNSLTDDQRTFSYEIKNNISAVVSDPNSRFITTVIEVIAKKFGVEQNKIILKGSWPANESHMFIERWIPTIAWYWPTWSGFHGVDEYADIDSVSESIRFLSDIAKAMK